MSKIINKFLLNEDRLMPELHLTQPGFSYSACGSFTKYCESSMVIEGIRTLLLFFHKKF